VLRPVAELELEPAAVDEVDLLLLVVEVRFYGDRADALAAVRQVN
jgi:hypothetical protein